MQNRLIPFSGAHAEDYDKRNAGWAPFRDALNLAAEIALRDSPDTARVLCVGAGTGAEIDHFAPRRPDWKFTAVDTSPDMLDICRQKAEAAGYADRCRFHAGTIDTLEEDGFDIAMAILVSQFLTDIHARTQFFAGIAQRLNMGAPLLVVDLAAPGESRDAMIDEWLSAPPYFGNAPRRTDFDEGVAVLAPRDLRKMIETAGFTRPRQFLQLHLMRGWRARRRATDDDDSPAAQM